VTENPIISTPAFKGLSVPAQWLFFTALREGPRRCGVVDVWPKRYSQLATGLDEDAIIGAALELDRAGVVIFDDETDEMLLPGYLTEVTPVNNKRMLIAVVNSIRGITSMKLIALIVGELQKLRAEHPDVAAWTDPRIRFWLDRTALTPADLAGGAAK
jgi:hypothetical protein